MSSPRDVDDDAGGDGVTGEDGDVTVGDDSDSTETVPGDDGPVREEAVEDDREWQVSLSDLEGDEPSTAPIEPESLSLENAVFVAVGAALTLLVVFGGI